MIELVVADTMQPNGCARRYHEIERGANRPPNSEWPGNPPGAILSLLMNVTRTNPHVACGSSFSRLRTSSALNSLGVGVTGFFAGRCAFVANPGATTAAPTNVARLRKFRRPTKSGS